MAIATRIAFERIRESISTQERLLDAGMLDRIEGAGALIAAALRDGGQILLFGNGGSAADATHLAAEFVGRFLRERAALPALSLSDNGSAVTAIGNDYGYEHVFARQIEGLGRPHDVVIAISTSGNSPNVVLGVEAARGLGLRSIALTGGSGGALRDACDICIAAPSHDVPRIQEAHILIGHILCELAEAAVA